MLKQSLKYRQQKGFTLVELLVVIAVIAVLMSILMPALNRAREQGKRAMCLGNLKSLQLGWLMYADENEGKIVSGDAGFDEAGDRVLGLEQDLAVAVVDVRVVQEERDVPGVLSRDCAILRIAGQRRKQQSNGSWGKSYETPMAIITLATPHRYIPIYQR